MLSRPIKKWIRFLSACLLLSLLILLFFNFLVLLKNNISNSLFSPNFFIKSKNSDSLKGVINKVLEDAKGTYGIAIKNLKTGQTYYQNEHMVFEAGSLYKVWIMAEVFNQIKKGTLKEDELLSEDVSELNNEFNIDPEFAELVEGSVSLTVDDAIKQMIMISHNYAALLLAKKVKLSTVAKFLKDNNFNESSVGTDGDSPKTTPYDIALFFEKLYLEKLSDSQNKEKMLELLKKQQLNDKLPKYLPKDTAVAHKTGEIDYLSHDGGIVFTPIGDYIIVVMSKSDLPEGAEERIAKISEAVYKYFVIE